MLLVDPAIDQADGDSLARRSTFCSFRQFEMRIGLLRALIAARPH